MVRMDRSKQTLEKKVLKIDGDNLSQKKEAKILGLIIDEKLT